MLVYPPPPAPPRLSPPRPPTAVLIVVGLCGLVVSVGGASAGFLRLYVQKAEVDFDWSECVAIVGIVAFVGAVLCLAQHEVGVPLVIGASATMVAVVGVTVASPSLEISHLLDAFPLRGLVFLASGLAGAVGVGVGIAGLRGRPSAGFAIPVAVLTLVSLVCTAALFRLDDSPRAFQVRPFAGFALIAVVGMACAFIGRHGMLVAAAGAAIIVTTFIRILDYGFGVREGALQADIATIAALVAVAVVGAVVTSRRTDALAYGSAAQLPFPPPGTAVDPIA